LYYVGQASSSVRTLPASESERRRRPALRESVRDLRFRGESDGRFTWFQQVARGRTNATERTGFQLGFFLVFWWVASSGLLPPRAHIHLPRAGPFFRL